MRHTHTYVTLDVSAAAYDEIAGKLRAADYGHCFNSSGEMDMSGIALVRGTDPLLVGREQLDGSKKPKEAKPE